MRSGEQTEMERTGGVFLTFCIVAGIAGLSLWVLIVPYLDVSRWLGILLSAAIAVIIGGAAASSPHSTRSGWRVGFRKTSSSSRTAASTAS